MTSRSINRLGHDSHGHGHDAHHHGPHPTFTPPYNAKLIGAITFGLVGGLGVLFVFSFYVFNLLLLMLYFI